MKSYPHPAWLGRTIFPFTSRFMEVGGNTIHYVDEGSGPVLLLLHGNASYSFLYREIIQALSTNFRCIALDYPGFGLSRARAGYGFTPREHSEVVEEFVSSLQLDSIRLMVHDWGGPIGLGFAGRRPELIHSLIIGNTWAWPAAPGSPVAKFGRLAGSPLGSFLIRRFNLLIRVMHPVASRRQFTAAEKRAYRGPYPTWESRASMAIFPKQILHSREFLAEVESGLKRLRQKQALLLWGDQDSGFADEELRRFKHFFPAATVKVLRGAKHFIQEDAPQEIARTILSLEQHAPDQ